MTMSRGWRSKDTILSNAGEPSIRMKLLYLKNKIFKVLKENKLPLTSSLRNLLVISILFPT